LASFDVRDTLIVTDTRALQKGFVLLVPAILFGLLIAAQWGTFASAVRQDVAIRYVEPLNLSVGGLQTQQDELKTQLAALRTELEDLQRTAATQTGATRDLQARLDQLRALAGLTAVKGEGLLVTLDALPLPAGPPERPACFAPDLTDITNAAWRAGATAISINGERVVASSSVYCVGTTIVVNGTLTAAPFDIAAIGDGAKLLASFDDPQQLRDLKRRRDERSIVLRASRQPDIAIGAYTGPISVRAAALE
jgi:uncharacterized protein YlxW (UPF0749 family)